jgi:restriction system protein
MMTTREEFEPLIIAEVDPKKCFRALRGIETPSYDEPSSVTPLMQFDRDDRRIVEGRDVVQSLDASTNLAAMDWEDFEHVVRELFAKMFSARSAGAEVHVTRASRDYGVDALVYDPDPIMGGKFVIQAKRYVNTVDVAAVRDLFGTVQNEGASKGFLVTTSGFGPDAHQFAKGKPLTLIDGPQLLGLLEQQGYAFRLDLKEARRVLHGS